MFVLETAEEKNMIGFVKNNKSLNYNYDIFITTKYEESNELFNNLLKKGIIVEGFKNLKKEEQINIYYQALLKPIGKYQISHDKTLELMNTN